MSKVSAKYFDPETLAKIQPLALRSRFLLEGYLAGLHRSPHRGQSVEFAEHREYAPGDDIRQVDWKVFARTDKYYLKQFEDETNLVVVVILDGSESMSFHSNERGLTKLEYAQLAALSLAYLVLDQRDAVALIPMTGEDRWLPPSNQPQRWQDMILMMEQMPSRASVPFGSMLGSVATKLNRRSLIVVLSDFLDELNPVFQSVRHWKFDGHDICFLQILDHAEQEFPFSQTTKFLGLEGWPNQTVDPVTIRESYLSEFRSHQSLLRAFCHQAEVDYEVFSTERPLSFHLPKFLGRRRNLLRQGRSHVG